MANQFLIKNTMADMRALSAAEITALQNETYSGVQLLGYYQVGDTPSSIVYYPLNTNDPDDGGSIIHANGIKLVHDFKGIVDVRYFGISASNSDNYSNFQKMFDQLKKATYHIPKGDFKLSQAVRIGDGVIIQGSGIHSTYLTKTTIHFSNNYNIKGPGNAAIDYNVDAVLIVAEHNKYCEGVTLSNLTIQHTVDAYNSTLSEIELAKSFNIYAPFCNFLIINNIETQRAGIGFYGQSIWMSSFKNSYFRNNKLGGLKIEGGTSTTITSCWSAACVKFAWDFNSTYSNMISCGADFIGESPQASPATAPCDYVYKISNGVNLINCGSEESKGILIKAVGTNGIHISSVIGFETLNYFQNSANNIPVIEAINNGSIIIQGGRIKVDSGGAGITGHFVKSTWGSNVVLNDVYTTHVQLLPDVVSNNSSIIYHSKGAMIENISNHTDSNLISTTRNITLGSSFNRSKLKFWQYNAPYQKMNIWMSGFNKNWLMYKDGDPASDSDGLVLTSNNHFASSSLRPLNAPTGYCLFDVTLGVPIWWNGNKWIASNGNAV